MFIRDLFTTVGVVSPRKRRSGWNSGGRMASGEGGSVPTGSDTEMGCPLPSRLRGLEKRRELPQRGPGQSPGRKRILSYVEGHRTPLFTAPHGMQTRSGNENSLRPSVSQTRGL